MSKTVTRTVDVDGFDLVEIEKDINSGCIDINITPSAGRGYGDESQTLDLFPEEAKEFNKALIEVIDTVAPDVRVTAAPAVPEPIPATGRIDLIQEYIDSQVPILIDYTKESGEDVVRAVSPYEIRKIKDGSPFFPPSYLVGWDHYRQEIRNFRISRINGLAPAPVAFRPEQ